MKFKAVVILAVLLAPIVSFAQPKQHAVLGLRDNQAAKDWMTQAYPIGNGRLGAMIFGGTDQEHIQFNENSLWTGDEQETGAYQAFADVFVTFEGKGNIHGYTRQLDIEKSIHQVQYNQNGVQFTRNYFASFPDQVLVFDYKASKKGAFTGNIRLVDAHGAAVKGDGNTLTIDASLENGMLYGATLKIVNKGGEVKLGKDSQGAAALEFKGVDAFTLFLVAATDYAPIRANKWKGDAPALKNKTTLANIGTKTVAQLQQRHVQDYQRLYNTFKLNIQSATAKKVFASTKEQIIDYKKTQDPALEVLLAQYGRYLLISSSRKGGLPANLQGLWNNSNTPPWRSDYHSNINVQMNYWPAEPANLVDSHVPYLDYINALREIKKENTQKEFPGVRGWTVRTENNIFGGESFSWNTPGSAWYAQALWEHYAFNQDKKYLKDFAYPILKEIVEFWDDHLKRREDGTLVAPNGWSPEHGPTEDGVTYDQQIIYDLFTNYVEAADSLGIDKSYRDRVFDMRERLLKAKIGKWGQLQEWETDRDDPKDTHRHVSHLFALHPGREIGVNTTPELAKAARISLEARGDESTGWSMAWKMNFWARLQDGNRAHRIVNNFISLVGGEGIDYNNGGGIYENLLCAHPPFQIDGNLGYVAGVTEMLLQSQEGFLDFLPALPDAWRKAGQVQGIRARGNYTLDFSWKDGQVTAYRIYSPVAKTVKVKINGEMKTVKAIVKK
ncbi:glycosyl hydrolase family 95 catalytic domain-containing protein [Sphingobacterium sp. Mn56C]|uniref:glycoside hydrolase family 95 protein n=1 Tax=Sphingobacterium sp. Mn56C TaxID=3395261 RepID=UPI003BBFC493